MSTGGVVPTAGRGRDRRFAALLLTVAAVAALGLVIAWLPGVNAPTPIVSPVTAPKAPPATVTPGVPDSEADRLEREFAQVHAREAREMEVAARFQQAAVMLHARQYEHAMTALHRVLKLQPTMPEAHVNMGFALLGAGQHKAAAEFFRGAIDLRPTQVNAYYGLGLALRALGDAPGAIGALQSYVHLAPDDDPYAERARTTLDAWREEDRRSGPPGHAAAGAG